MVRKKKSAQETSAIAEPIVVEETVPKGDLRALLEEIKNYEGVIGYILRNTSTASINLNDPAKITDYAILTSSAFDASKDLSKLFDLGNVENSIFDGRKIKMLSVIIGKNRISIFAEKGTALGKILLKLHTS
jgi:predicted regulator of Ras-like GTPase activity (Roadblock/LC7/MglB family)